MESYSSDHMLLILQGHCIFGIAPIEEFKPQANMQHWQLKIKKPQQKKTTLHCEVDLVLWFWVFFSWLILTLNLTLV